MDFEPSVTLHNGQKMPMLGLGTWQSPPNEVREAVKTAIDVGYRMFDTAYFYGNEAEVGQAVQQKIDKGKIKRDDIFITTKELESAVDQGLVRAIGLSNFNSVQTEYILEHARIKPANMQVQSLCRALPEHTALIPRLYLFV
ncbi:hypothetical protein RvY_08324 [Ramazzottius varieornatus]|uniref:NADP-dependent oxidoreductase domain-containing protein n=1 Tax=Ramazzottius varieornatus TaxID=947166 RepID=A0A1D1V7S7_RAMVA|nr:hypothetical protein RvY_08324 [Ramazzottius varieornatus]